MMDIVKIESKVEQYKLMDLVGLQTVLDKIEEVDKDLNVARGLVYMRAKEICFDEGGAWETFVKQLIVGGKSVQKKQSDTLIMIAKMKLDSVSSKQVGDTSPDTLTIPESTMTVNKLIGGTPMEKVENFNEINSAFGKEQSTGAEVDYYNKTMTGDDEEKQEFFADVKKSTGKDSVTVSDAKKYAKKLAADEFESDSPQYENPTVKKHTVPAGDDKELIEKLEKVIAENVRLKERLMNEDSLKWLKTELTHAANSIMRDALYFQRKENAHTMAKQSVGESLGRALELLGFTVDKFPTEEQAKAAFRERAKKAHPDVGGNTEEFKALNEAHAAVRKALKGKK